MFIIRGLYLKANPDMTFDEFLKSDLLKELAKERKDGFDRFKIDEPEVESKQ